jgi:hypothetical protein
VPVHVRPGHMTELEILFVLDKGESEKGCNHGVLYFAWPVLVSWFRIYLSFSKSMVQFN